MVNLQHWFLSHSYISIAVKSSVCVRLMKPNLPISLVSRKWHRPSNCNQDEFELILLLLYDLWMFCACTSFLKPTKWLKNVWYHHNVNVKFIVWVENPQGANESYGTVWKRRKYMPQGGSFHWTEYIFWFDIQFSKSMVVEPSQRFISLRMRSEKGYFFSFRYVKICTFSSYF